MSTAMTDLPTIEPLDHAAVRKILKDHQRFRDSHGAEGRVADFSYNAIKNFDFGGMDLSGVHFQRAILEHCGFKSSLLHDSDFWGASVPDTDFSGVDLVRCAMTEVNLRDCCFDGANLGGARFYNSDLTGSSFRNVDLTGGDISGCDLTKTVFDGAILDAACIEDNRGRGSSWIGVQGTLRLGALPRQD